MPVNSLVIEGSVIGADIKEEGLEPPCLAALDS